MDSRAEEALADLCRKALEPELAVLERRLQALERSPVVSFSQREAIEQRRRVVKRAREEGLSVERIARAFAIPTSTVWRDLDETAPRAPARVVGVDGRAHRSTHAWGRRNGDGAGGGGAV